jgi:hypothetical protein
MGSLPAVAAPVAAAVPGHVAPAAVRHAATTLADDATPAPSETAAPSDSPTDVPAASPVPTDVPAASPVPTDVPAASPVPTDTAEPTPAPVDASPAPTVTPGETAPATPEPSASPTPPVVSPHGASPAVLWVAALPTAVGDNTGCADPGYNTIADAVDEASAGDTVHVCPGTYHLEDTISVTVDDLHLVGDDAATTIIDGTNEDSPVQLIDATGQTIHVTSLTLRNGHAANGGGAIHAAAVELMTSVFTNNTDTDGESGGGAVYGSSYAGGYGCTFRGNSAAGAGGAVMAPTVQFNFTAFTDNTAVAGAGAIAASSQAAFNADTFTGNTATGPSGAGGAIISGGGALYLTYSTFDANTAGDAGGAISADGGTIIGSTFSGNHAGAGGGAIADWSGAITVANSTLTDNIADANGGAIIAGANTVMLLNSTLVGNASSPDGGETVRGNSLSMANTIIANDAESTGDCIVAGAIDDGGGNVYTSSTCGSSPVALASVKLSALADNGGATKTVALQPGSVAIGAGVDAVCAASPVDGVDQRGETREAACDSGAFELVLQAQSITSYGWNDPQESGTAMVAESDATASASATSGLDVVYGTSTPDVCTIDAASGALTLLSAGTCTVTFDQPGDATWAPAEQQTISFDVVAPAELRGCRSYTGQSYAGSILLNADGTPIGCGLTDQTGSPADLIPANWTDTFNAQFGSGQPVAYAPRLGWACDDCWIGADGEESVTGLPIGFPINFYGTLHDTVFVNSNGSISFGTGSWYYDVPLNEILNGAAGVVAYGMDLDNREITSPSSLWGSGRHGDFFYWGRTTVNGRQAFAATWMNMQTYRATTGKTDWNTFQIVLVDRSDVAANDVDVIVNYGGLQANSKGYGDGCPDGNDTCVAIGVGSVVDGNTQYASIVDDNGVLYNGRLNADVADDGAHPLDAAHLNSSTPGRFIFQMRDGKLPQTATAPGAPTITDIAAGDGQGVVSWSDPADIGGSPILGYVMQWRIAGSSDAWSSTDCDASGCLIDSLANGTVYEVEVAAVNGVGQGDWSAPATFAPVNANLDHLVVSPAGATIAAGESQAYTAEGFDASDNSLGDVTGETAFAIAGGGSCTAASCTSTVPGDHTVTGTLGEAAGTATLHVDASAEPRATISVRAASGAVGTTGTPFVVAWQGSIPANPAGSVSANGSSPFSYTVTVSRDGAPYAPFSTGTATSRSVTLAFNHRYTFKVVATVSLASPAAVSPMVAGSSAPAYSSVTPRIAQSSIWGMHLRATTAWRGVQARGSSATGYHVTTTRRSSSTFTFTGRNFVWAAPLFRNGGSAKVYIDGHLVGTVSLRAAATSMNHQVFRWSTATSGRHTFKLVVTTSGRRVGIDAYLWY